MKRRKLWLMMAATLSLLLFLSLTGAAAAADCEKNLTVTYGQTEARAMLTRINDLRLPENAWYWDASDTSKEWKTNRSPLTYDYGLEEVAMLRAAELAVSFSHTRPDGTSCFTANPYQWNSIGENIAMGYQTEESVFIGWSEEDEPYAGQGHRRNMLSDSFTHVGIGHAVVDGVHYWVQEFSRPSTGVSYVSPLDGEKDVSISMGSHTLTEAAVNNTDCYFCTNCEKFFSDAAGENELTFSELLADNVTLTPETAVYKGSAYTPTVTVKNAAGETLTEGTDYTVDVPAGRTAIGYYVYTVTGIGRYTGTVEKTFTIKANTTNSYDITVTPKQFVYDGKNHLPAVTVTAPDGTRLKPGTDYAVSYPASSVNPGFYRLSIVFLKPHATIGTLNATYSIIPQTLLAENVTLYASSVEYNGKVRTPVVTVKNAAGETLTKGTDYTVDVPEGRKIPGTYVYTITGKGGYTGTVNANFVIKPYTIKDADVTLYSATVEYNSKQRTPKVTVKTPWGVTLTEGTHYTVTAPAGRTIPGTYVYTITAGGTRFTGTANARFVIKPCTLTAKNVTLYSASVEYNSKQRTPKVTVKSPWGVTLTEGTHYTVTVPEGRTVPGTYVYIITGTGSRFTGTVNANFVIKPCTLTAANVTLYSAEVTYNGKQRTPKVTVKSPWGVTLTEGTHYTLTQPGGRTDAGSYQYVIKGKGRFTGTVSADFVIKPQALEAENVTLYSAEVTYNGKVRTPSVTVKNTAGSTLKKDTDYAVTVPEGRKDAGTYVYTITGQGNYAGAVKKDFVIKPASSGNPTAALTATNNIAASQTVTLTMGDGELLQGYYWGVNADCTKNKFYDLSAYAVDSYVRNLTLTAPGTYYFTAENQKGKRSETLSVTFYRTTLDPNGGTISQATLLNKANVPITLPTPVKNGGEFEFWSGDGEWGCNYTPTANRDLIASYRVVDNVPPTVKITSTNYVGDEQLLTVEIEDETRLTAFYWGTDPDYTKNERLTLSGVKTLEQKTITQAGTYYLCAEDAAGNITQTSVTYHLTTLNPNGGFVSPKKILTMAGNAFPLPTPEYENLTFKGWSAKAEDLTADGYRPKASSTLKAVWG